MVVVEVTYEGGDVEAYHLREPDESDADPAYRFRVQLEHRCLSQWRAMELLLPIPVEDGLVVVNLARVRAVRIREE